MVSTYIALFPPSTNHSLIHTYIHTPMYTDTGELSVLPKDTLTVWTGGSWTQTVNTWV